MLGRELDAGIVLEQFSLGSSCRHREEERRTKYLDALPQMSEQAKRKRGLVNIGLPS
jgi:hypothetical protein